MRLTITHACGRSTAWWAPDDGGYVHRETDSQPASTGPQPTINGSALRCGKGGASLLRAVRRYLRHVRRADPGFYCSCGAPKHPKQS